ncbi:MAG: hypothetical protein KKG00_06565 [Bacteroidetes bacterium]|nr:hypothetical protein [Bacteroidota bacterium]
MKNIPRPQGGGGMGTICFQSVLCILLTTGGRSEGCFTCRYLDAVREEDRANLFTLLAQRFQLFAGTKQFFFMERDFVKFSLAFSNPTDSP